jgi:molecular chaperone HtpG
MKHGESPVRWSSAGAGTFTVARGERQEPGTTITLHLKGDQHEFAHGYRLRDIIGKYSDFVGFPILVDGERANQPVALWTQPRSAVSDAQHEEFYRHVTGGLSDDKPIARVHYSVDAPVQFQALVYVPEKAPLDLFQKDRGGLRLYAKRVLILESCEKLLPSWLRFVRGVVDSEDLSLNVSREMLQESRALSQIEQLLTKQVIKSLKELAEGEPEKYEAFWRAFGKVVKEGVSSDFRNKDAVVELARFESMRGEGGKLTSLDAYVAAMPEGQSAIYYLTGPSRRAVEASPQLEALRDKGYDVLFLVDPIDEWVVSALPEHKSKKLVSVAHGEVELGESPTSEEPEKALDAVRTTLGERVKSVRFSRRLKESAACLVADVGDPGANMERILRMLDERADTKKRILELNPTHAIVRDIAALQAREPGSTRVASYCEALYDQALLADGVVEDPAALVRRMRELLAQAARSAATEGGGPGAASQ